MKVLIIYYTQSGNTLAIAKHIAAGMRSVGAEVTGCRVKDATYDMLKDYDLIGFGSPVWKADTPIILLTRCQNRMVHIALHLIHMALCRICIFRLLFQILKIMA